MKKKHLTQEERYIIFFELQRKSIVRFIARQLKRSHTSILKEINRNGGYFRYNSECAQARAVSVRKKASEQAKELSSEKKRYITDKLINLQLSPEQISGRYFLEKNEKLSVKAIYNFIRKNKKNKGKLYLHLRRSHKKYNKKKKKEAGRGCIPNRISIDKKLSIEVSKSQIGDFEADLMSGKNHKSFLLTIVDRYTKITFIKKIKNKKSEIVSKSIIKILKEFSKCYSIYTITFDNGKEFANHAHIAKSLKVKTFFADPYSSWQRGLNEHTNGLIRQYLPKKTCFTTISHEKVQDIQDLINNRPRKVLGFLTPLEKLNQSILHSK